MENIVNSSVPSRLRQLFTAIENKNTEEIRSLLRKLGDYVNYKSPDGRTPLHVVAELGDAEILKLFVQDKNVDIYVQDNNGSTPLHYVIERNQNFEELAKILIEAGANIGEPDKNGKSPLHILIEKQVNSKIIKLLISIKCSRGENPLFVAVRAGNAETTQLLIDYGSDVNCVSLYGSTVLHQATAITKNDDNLSTVEVLLKNGANVNAQDNYGKTPLHRLVNYCNINNAKTIKLLLDYKADANVRDNLQGLIPLVYAIENNYDVTVVQLLLDYGSDVNCPSNFKRTPLHHAAEHYYEDSCEIFKCLLINGADANALDNQGHTALLILLKTSSCSCHFMKTLQSLLKYSDINVIDQTKKELLSFITVEEKWKIFLRHLAKLQALELAMNPAFEHSISNRSKYSNYFENCLKELSKAKNTKPKNCWVSFFNLLVDDRKKLKNYAGNADLVKDFKNEDCLNNFPLFGRTIVKNMMKGIKRRKLFDKSAGMLSNNLPIFSPTHLVIRDILDCCLTIPDLSKLSD